MSDKTTIEWADATWWASSRLPGEATAPLRWRRTRRALVRYYTTDGTHDLFAPSVTDDEIDRVFAVMALARKHTFVVLTQYPDRMREYLSQTRGSMNVIARIIRSAQLTPKPESACARGDFAHDMGWPIPNVWLGVPVEDQTTADERIPPLLQTPAAVRVVSAEPLLGPVDFRAWTEPTCARCEARGWVPVDGGGTACPACFAEKGGSPGPLPSRLDQIIVGGESGPDARPCDTGWIRSTVWQCKLAGVACFVKQLGAQPRAIVGESVRVYHFRDRKGADMTEWPEDIRVRELPGQVRA